MNAHGWYTFSVTADRTSEKENEKDKVGRTASSTELSQVRPAPPQAVELLLLA